MKPFLYQALVANAASLGVHWIYNHKKLKEIAQKQSLLFLSQDQTFYDNAKPSYYVYPKNKIGDLSVQGQMLTWLYKGLKDNPNFQKHDYELLLIDKFMPGGKYQGYVESYAKKLIISKLSDELKLNLDKQKLDDTHLVGFLPYLATKSLGLSIDKAIELTTLFSINNDYQTYMLMFEQLFIALDKHTIKDAVLKTIKYAPKHELLKFEHISSIDDIDQFIESYAGRACSIDQSVPLVMYILYHAKSYEKALEINAQVGGASSDRALLLATFLSQVYDMPSNWKEKTKKQLNALDYQ